MITTEEEREQRKQVMQEVIEFELELFEQANFGGKHPHAYQLFQSLIAEAIQLYKEL